VPVTYEDRQKAMQTLAKIKNVRGGNFRSVVNDSILHGLFLPRSLPHTVWVNPAGVIVSITSGASLSATNITKMMEGQTLDLPKIFEKKVAWHTPLLGEQFQDKVLYSSTLTTYLENYYDGLLGGGDSSRLTLTNAGLTWLYIQAFQHLEIGPGNDNMSFGTPGRVIWEVQDSSLLILDHWFMEKYLQNNKPLWTEWLRRFGFCYEIQTPKEWNGNKKQEIMVEDLNRFFGAKYGLKGMFEKRKRKVLALIVDKKGGKKPFVTNGDTPLLEHNRFFIKLKNQPIHILSQFIGGFYLHKTVANQIKTDKNIDIEIACDLTNLKDINSALTPYGIKIVEQEVLQDMIIIRQIDDRKFSLDGELFGVKFKQ
jgi:hypothetical protein